MTKDWRDNSPPVLLNTLTAETASMSDVDLTAPIDYRQLSDCEGYRFGSNGSIQSCWAGSGNGSYLSDQWHDLNLRLVKGRKYLTVCIKRGGKRFKTAVHPLILEAFAGPAPPGMECRHKDDNPLNNRADNLVWGTRFENMDDRRRNGIMVRGEKQWMAKMTEPEIREIRSRYSAGGVTLQQLADQFGITYQTVHNIVIRKTWKHVV